LIQRDTPKLKSIKLALPIERIFSYTNNCILIATRTLIAKFDFEQSKIIDQYEFEEVMKIKQIIRKEHMAVVSHNKIIIIDENFEKLT
jgi:hypothetical protein